MVCSKWKRITRVTTPMKNFWQGLIFSSYHASLKLTSTFDGKSVLREVFFFFFVCFLSSFKEADVCQQPRVWQRGST